MATYHLTATHAPDSGRPMPTRLTLTAETPLAAVRAAAAQGLLDLDYAETEVRLGDSNGVLIARYEGLELVSDRQTEIWATKDILRAFLETPATALPSARMDDPDTDAWAVIRAYMGDEADAYIGDEVYLSADAPMFRGGRRITLY